MALGIIGFPRSNFVRTVRMVAVEKQVEYKLVPEAPHSELVKSINPFGLIPCLRHDGLEIAESQAIARYLDAIGDGPSLIPKDNVAAARVNHWVSLIATPRRHGFVAAVHRSLLSQKMKVVTRFEQRSIRRLNAFLECSARWMPRLRVDMLPARRSPWPIVSCCPCWLVCNCSQKAKKLSPITRLWRSISTDKRGAKALLQQIPTSGCDPMTVTSIDTGTPTLLCEIEERVATITLNRPEARNALGDELTPRCAELLRSWPTMNE